jgi:HK97 gp10 family phage protein
VTTVEGLAQLKARWGRMPEIARDMVRREMEVIADGIVADMKRLAPKGLSLALVNSIGWTWGNAPRGSVSVGTVRGRQFSRMAITIYAGTRDKSLGSADAFYARFQEFGTVKMAANPFFYPSWRANKTRVKASLTRAVKRAVKKA